MARWIPIVNINNAQASVAQWADLHGLALTDAQQEMVDGRGAAELGRSAGALYACPSWAMARRSIPAMSARPAPFMLEAGISSARRMARFWGLAPAAAVRSPHRRLVRRSVCLPKSKRRWRPHGCTAGGRSSARLKAAGLPKS